MQCQQERCEIEETRETKENKETGKHRGKQNEGNRGDVHVPFHTRDYYKTNPEACKRKHETQINQADKTL